MLRLLEVQKIAREHGMDLILSGNSQFSKFVKAYAMAHDIVIKALNIEEPDDLQENLEMRIQFEILVTKYTTFILGLK
jgi:hypothetical protein